MNQMHCKKILLVSFFVQMSSTMDEESDYEKNLYEQELDHKGNEFKGTVDPKSRAMIRPFLTEALLLMSSKEYNKAFRLLEKAMQFINPIDNEMTNRVKLNHIICNKNRRLGASGRLQNAIIRADMAKGLRMANSFEYCFENEIYIHEISAHINQCNPRENYSTTGARVALKLIKEYREILTNEMPHALKSEEIKLKVLEKEAQLAIDYGYYFEAHRLRDLGLHISAANLMSKIDKKSPIYGRASRVIKEIVRTYGNEKIGKAGA